MVLLSLANLFLLSATLLLTQQHVLNLIVVARVFVDERMSHTKYEML